MMAKAERTKTTNTLTYCLIFEGSKAHLAKSGRERRRRRSRACCGASRSREAGLATRQIPPALRLVCLCICERIPHNCTARTARGAHEQSICIPISWPNGISFVYCTLGREFQSSKLDFGPCYRSHLRLCCIRVNRGRDIAFRHTSRRLLAKNHSGGPFTFDHGCANDPFSCRPSSRWRHHADSIARHHFKTQRTCHYRSGGRHSRCTSLRD